MPQSQASQFSDQYPSSFFEENPLDKLSTLPSDGPFNPSYGQSTPNPSSSTEFTQPVFSPVILETLERVGPAKNKNYILWTEMVNDDFVRWWLNTEYGSEIKRNIFIGKRHAESWDYFHQVAAVQNGYPKVMCKKCDHILAHPADRHRGTSTMNRHYSQGTNCWKLPPHSQDIRRLIHNGVWISYHISIFHLKPYLTNLLIRHVKLFKKYLSLSKPGWRG